MSEPRDDLESGELRARLPTLDVDPARAAAITDAARRGLAHGPPRRRWLEPILVTLLVGSFLGWALWHAYQALR